MAQDLCWPFLIGAGRRQDYRILLAPDFLVDRLDYGVLDEVAQPGPDRSIVVTTRGGRRLGIAYTTQLSEEADEYGRRLRLIFGVICPDARIAEVASSDLETAHAAALATYRRFLADEEGFTVMPAPAFGMTASVVQPLAAAARAPTPTPARWRWGLVAVAGVVLAVILLMVLRPTGSGDEPNPTCSPSISGDQLSDIPSTQPDGNAADDQGCHGQGAGEPGR